MKIDSVLKCLTTGGQQLIECVSDLCMSHGLYFQTSLTESLREAVTIVISIIPMDSD